jgi:hypothetical protein
MFPIMQYGEKKKMFLHITGQDFISGIDDEVIT